MHDPEFDATLSGVQAPQTLDIHNLVAKIDMGAKEKEDLITQLSILKLSKEHLKGLPVRDLADIVGVPIGAALKLYSAVHAGS